RDFMVVVCCGLMLLISWTLVGVSAPAEIPRVRARFHRSELEAAVVACGMPTTNLRGIFSMLAAVVAFAVMDGMMKTLSADYPAMQVTFLRGIASLPLLLGAAAVFGRWSDLRAKRWGLHLMRGFLSVMLLWCFVYAISQLSLANAYSIFMSAPLL